ncbi:MAG: DNA polymerase I, partial [candidate division KSB1 bacterium]|nr:DNA polymerase I [candidate division KSB1 bacterium]
DPMQAQIVGLSFSWNPGEAYFIPTTQSTKPRNKSLFTEDVSQQPLDINLVLRKLKPVLEDDRLHKCGQNIKYDMMVLKRHGVSLRGLDFDTMIASYLLNPSGRQHNLDSLSLEYLNYKKIPTSELIGSGKKQISMAEVPLEKVAHYACEDADITQRLRNVLEPRLKETGLLPLFQEVELPLISVLMEMEMNGVSLDVEFLHQMSLQLEKDLQKLEEEIYQLAGQKFNINSPKQLSEILFQRLKLPVLRRTKTGLSTDVSVLEELAKKHPLPRQLLEYRQLMKLKSTYVDALPKLINPETGRVHTSFNQTVTATGRLSSSDPNLQNIPIRTEVGAQIRRAFVPQDEDHVILDADYSQIELRIMAHLSKDSTLMESFQRGEDVHLRTAALIFNVPPEQVTADQRRQAKTVNFGIMYGMGAYGLAQRLEITPEEGQDFITDYFIKYPGVNDFIIKTISEARKRGYVTTLLNRRRYLPEILSDNRRMREFAERTAINTPIQGTAADLIKVAMINISRRLKERGLKTKMILQVHDELVFEVPKEELEQVRQLVKQEMEGAIQLDVPIKVDIGVGANWLEAH